MHVVQTNHTINQTIMRAVYKGLIAAGMRARNVSAEQPPMSTIDACISYGVLRGTLSWYQAAETFIYIDNSYFRANHFDGYYRLSRGGFQPAYQPTEAEKPIKANAIQPRGQKVLILPHTPPFEAVLGLSGLGFTQMIIDWLAHHGIVDYAVREKSNATNPFEEALEGVGLVVAANSGAALKAIKLGVPAVSMAPTTLWSFMRMQPYRKEMACFDGSNPLETSPHEIINLCSNTDYTPLWSFIEQNEYNLNEIERGLPWMQYTSDGTQGRTSPTGYARIPLSADGRIQRPRYMR